MSWLYCLSLLSILLDNVLSAFTLSASRVTLCVAERGEWCELAIESSWQTKLTYLSKTSSLLLSKRCRMAYVGSWCVANSGSIGEVGDGEYSLPSVALRVGVIKSFTPCYVRKSVYFLSFSYVVVVVVVCYTCYYFVCCFYFCCLYFCLCCMDRLRLYELSGLVAFHNANCFSIYFTLLSSFSLLLLLSVAVWLVIGNK